MIPPGARRITDPEAEVERLAALRKQPLPGSDEWRVETAAIEGFRVTHLATGKHGEAATRDEALGKLVGELVAAGIITINEGRAALGLRPMEMFDGPFAS